MTKRTCSLACALLASAIPPGSVVAGVPSPGNITVPDCIALDGVSCVGANDLATWLSDFGSGQPRGRSDYDCSHTIGANDLALWLTVFGSGTMTSACAPGCP